MIINNNNERYFVVPHLASEVHIGADSEDGGPGSCTQCHTLHFNVRVGLNY